MSIARINGFADMFEPESTAFTFMESQCRKTIARMAMTDIEHGLNGCHIDARYDHRLYALFALACNDLFAVGIKFFAI